ncbi:hypothetical protein B488_03350 [Liberibacter crescens BT-1]|uniref:Uncharacterized protein n=1 Tax=Liberibacter crescens (strain BT-1) TaxID=1215343 RepID=L0EUH8_LIBCB|nr:hypothetical protein B488_03350 [Liberibacter crescens BT-1]
MAFLVKEILCAEKGHLCLSVFLTENSFFYRKRHYSCIEDNIV